MNEPTCPMPHRPMPHRAIHRRDRAVEDDAWIAAFLKRAPVGTLSSLHEGRPHANMNLFVFDEAEHALYLHTAREGATRASIESDPWVCFSAHEMGRLLPAEMAVNFSVEFAGVVAFGQAEVVSDAGTARRALELLMAKYAPHLELGRDYGGVRDRDLAGASSWNLMSRISRTWSLKRLPNVSTISCVFRRTRPPIPGKATSRCRECRRVCPPRVEVVGLCRPVEDLTVFYVDQQRL